jgi:hypothetical protein
VADEDDGGDDVDNNQSDVDTAEDVAEQSTGDGISRTNNKTQRKKRKGDDESGMDATGGRPRRRSAGRRVGRGRGGAEAEGAAAERVVGGDLARNNLDDD